MIRRTWLRATPRPGWDAVRQRVFLRAAGRCEVVVGPSGGRCPERARDIHHVIARSKFGANRREEADAMTNLAAVCRAHHDAASAAYYKGRLHFVELTPAGWECVVFRKASKWSWA